MTVVTRIRRLPLGVDWVKSSSFHKKENWGTWQIATVYIVYDQSYHSSMSEFQVDAAELDQKRLTTKDNSHRNPAESKGRVSKKTNSVMMFRTEKKAPPNGR